MRRPVRSRILSMLPIAVALGFGEPVEAAQLGVHDQPGCNAAAHSGVQNVAAFANWLGRRPDRIMDFTFLDNWNDLVRSIGVLSACWQQAGYTNLTFGLAMMPTDGASTLVQGANGAYDIYFRKIAETLVAYGYPNAVLRVGWEFNITTFPWSAKSDPASYVRYFRRIVRVMRSVPGQHFMFDWNYAMNGDPQGPEQFAPDQAYPGDDYVDYIGADVYNQWWNPTTEASPIERWRAFLDEPYGLRWQAAFAAQHGKQISFPEWATGTRPDGHGGGDDPVFVRKMAKWMKLNNAAYADYWDEDDAGIYDGSLSDFPQAAAQFKASFGS